MAYTIKKKDYVSMYGPTVGDKIRLGDTDIIIEVEKDFTTYGEEVKFGGGKTIRDGMGQNSFITHDEGALDLLITNAVILDYTGIYKANIGVSLSTKCYYHSVGLFEVNYIHYVLDCKRLEV